MLNAIAFAVIAVIAVVEAIALSYLSASHALERRHVLRDWLTVIADKDNDVRALVETLVRKEGHQVVFARRPQKVEPAQPGWLDKKPLK